MKYRLFRSNYLTLIIISGLILRFLFLFYGAEIYYQRTVFYVMPDTRAWQKCIENLIHHGEYALTHNNGYFARMPGYSFFMGIFYFFSGFDWDQAYKLIAVFQTALDILCIKLIYGITRNIYRNNKKALISAILYAIYPFVIVWNPICISESLSVFLVIFFLFYFIKSYHSKSNILFSVSAIILALACLTRPQIIPLFPIATLSLFLKRKTISLKKITVFAFSFLLIFGFWPLRNYINHDKLLITKNADGFPGWTIDVISFMQYTYSVKTDWDPQYTSIIQNTTTTYPEISYFRKDDSLKLVRAIYLAKNCGSGFSNKKGYWNSKIQSKDENCNKEIAKIFKELRSNQIKENPLNFYIYIPLENLKKAIFKSSLINKKSNIINILSSFLFGLRTFLIIIGFLGLFINLNQTSKIFSLISILFFLSVYITLCFGTAPFMRNIEIRYFLVPDVLLLISASHFFIFLKKNYQTTSIYKALKIKMWN
tara:strand:+ start:1151 stop:2599 length:1449 start_codon:yes stop_codon:yes gene_type:complete